MKRITVVLSICFAAILALAISGCGSATPSQLTRNAMDAVKTGNFAALSQYCTGDNPLQDITSDKMFNRTDASGETTTELTDDQKAVLEDAIKKMLQFDYTIGQETVDGDTATVSVSFNAYGVGTVFTESFKTYLTNAFSAAFLQAFGGPAADTEKLTTDFINGIKHGVEDLKDKSFTAEGTITLKKVDNYWKIESMSDEVLDAMTGGFISSMTELSDSMKALGNQQG